LGTHTPRRAFLILGAIMVVLLASLVGVGFAIHAQIAEVEAMSARAEATVVGVRKVRTEKGHNRYVVYRWTYEGETFEQDSRGTDESAEVGDRVPIQFDPDDPKLVGEDSWGSRWAIVVVLCLPAALFLGLLLLVGLNGLKNLRQLRAARPSG
jgi:hypothetical protein